MVSFFIFAERCLDTLMYRRLELVNSFVLI